jgi:hypothetical protein
VLQAIAVQAGEGAQDLGHRVAAQIQRAEAILETRVLATVIDGRIVFAAQAPRWQAL